MLQSVNMQLTSLSAWVLWPGMLWHSRAWQLLILMIRIMLDGAAVTYSVACEAGRHQAIAVIVTACNAENLLNSKPDHDEGSRANHASRLPCIHEGWLARRQQHTQSGSEASCASHECWNTTRPSCGTTKQLPELSQYIDGVLCNLPAAALVTLPHCIANLKCSGAASGHSSFEHNADS